GASVALNFTAKDKWFKIVLPQSIPPTIPMLVNYFIILFIEVPVASTICVLEILAKANSFGFQHFRYIEALTIAALIFLVLSYPSSLFINYLEKKMNRRFEKKTT